MKYPNLEDYFNFPMVHIKEITEWEFMKGDKFSVVQFLSPQKNTTFPTPKERFFFLIYSSEVSLGHGDWSPSEKFLYDFQNLSSIVYLGKNFCGSGEKHLDRLQVLHKHIPLCEHAVPDAI